MNTFNDIIGNDPIKRHLETMVQKEAIGSLILFAGPESAQKEQFAKALAEMVICRNDERGVHRYKLNKGSHPDFHLYKPEGKAGFHSILSMRQLTQEIYQKPNEAPRNVFIIEDADRMLPTSSNALLKAFEEPLLTSFVILVTSAKEAMLPTICSRCRIVKFSGVERLAVGIASEDGLKNVLAAYFCKGGEALYSDMQQLVGSISEGIDAKKKVVEDALTLEVQQRSPEKLSAVQKLALEREVEGAVSACVRGEVDQVLGMIQGWYRDMELLSSGVDEKYLLNKDLCQLLHQTLSKRDKRPKSSDIEEAVKSAKIAIDRSSTINSTLEALFLKLEM